MNIAGRVKTIIRLLLYFLRVYFTGFLRNFRPDLWYGRKSYDRFSFYVFLKLHFLRLRSFCSTLGQNRRHGHSFSAGTGWTWLRAPRRSGLRRPASSIRHTAAAKRSIGTRSRQSRSATSQMLPDGRILRLSQYFGFTSQVVKLVRTNVDGSVDSAFAPDFSIDGVVPYLPYELSVLSNGKILVLRRTSRNHQRLHLIQFNADGSRDKTFGVNGAKELRLPYRHTVQQQESFPFGMEILPNGKILIAGATNYSTNSNNFEGLYLARLTRTEM